MYSKLYARLYEDELEKQDGNLEKLARLIIRDHIMNGSDDFERETVSIDDNNKDALGRKYIEAEYHY